MEEFLKSEGFVGGTYKVSTTRLEQILKNYRKELLKELKNKYPNDQELGREVRKIS
jgi:hypothetical protein